MAQAKELARLDAEVARLVTFIRTTDAAGNPGAFDAVRQSLELVSRQQREARARLDELSRAGASSEPSVPTVDEIMAYVVDVEVRLQDDPTTAREALRAVLVDGRITPTPQPDGSWKADSALIFGRLPGRVRKAPKPRAPSASAKAESGVPRY